MLGRAIFGRNAVLGRAIFGRNVRLEVLLDTRPASHCSLCVASRAILISKQCS